MKKQWIWPAFLVLLAAAAVFFSAGLDQALQARTVSLPATTKPVVVLDPGHGGMDGGAECGGVIEKHINLTIARKTAALCRLFGFEVIMTRDSDVSIHDSDKTTVRSQKRSDLHNRLAIMTETPGSVVVSIHLNKFPESYVHGAQVFYAPKTEESKILAETMRGNIQEVLQPDNEREIKRADSSLFLLYNNTVNPAVLLECGFISNPDESLMLRDDEYQDKIALMICYTLIEFQNGGEPSDDATMQ